MLLNGMPHDGESKKNGYALIHFLKYACLSVLMMPTLSTVSMSSLLSKRSGFFRQLDDSIYPEVQEMLSVYIDIRHPRHEAGTCESSSYPELLPAGAIDLYQP